MAEDKTIELSRASADRVDGKKPYVGGRAKVRHTLSTFNNWKGIPFQKTSTVSTVIAIDNKKLEMIKNQFKRPKVKPTAAISNFGWISKQATRIKDNAISWLNKGHNKKFAIAAGIIGAAMFAYNNITNSGHKKVISSIKGEYGSIIANKYQRGYDTIKEYMTDFGSPLHLAKTASKTITPYLSSTRRGVITTTNAITNSNQALFASKRAIGHHRY